MTYHAALGRGTSMVWALPNVVWYASLRRAIEFTAFPKRMVDHTYYEIQKFTRMF